MQLIVIADDKEVVRLQCAGEITQNDVQNRRDPVEALLGWGGYSRKVLLNLDKTTYIDSSGISWLLTLHKHFNQAGGKLVLHSVPPAVRQVMQLLRIPMVLHVVNDEATAQKLVAGEKG